MRCGNALKKRPRHTNPEYTSENPHNAKSWMDNF
jgi:hypothetical protein